MVILISRSEYRLFSAVDPEKMQRAFGDMIEIGFGKEIGMGNGILIQQSTEKYLLKW